MKGGAGIGTVPRGQDFVPVYIANTFVLVYWGNSVTKFFPNGSRLASVPLLIALLQDKGLG